MQPTRLPLIELKTPVSAAETLSDRYRALVALALKADEPLVAISTNGLRTAPMRMPAGMHAQIEAAAQAAGVDFKTAFASLCSRGQDLHEKERESYVPELTRFVAKPIDESQFKSPQQAQFYKGLSEGLDACRLVMCEGSTGIGKSRVMARVALEQAKAGKTPVVVAGPTLAVLAHLHEEFLALGNTDVPVSVIVGASEFVDDEALLEYLQRAENDPDLVVDEGVRMWVAGGARAINTNVAAAKALGENACWLMEDLRSLCDLMDPDDFRLIDEVDKQGRSQSRENVARMRQQAMESTGVVLCTHMMLAIGQRIRWRGILPAPKVLLVDEIHLLESTIASANSLRFSTYTASIALRQHMAAHGDDTTSKKALASIKKLSGFVESLLARGESVLARNGESLISAETRAQLLELTDTAHKLLGSSKLAGMAHQDMLVKALRNFSRTLQGQTQDIWAIERTQSKGYAALLTGPSSVRMQLGDIWKTAEGGAGLVSATLYAINEDGEYRCDYMRMVLNLPITRVETPVPVREKHITQLPTLHTPTAATSAMLIPPAQRDDDDDEIQWQSRLAQVVAMVDARAKGGVLVLCTAYADVRALETNLRDLLGERLVAQAPGRRFQGLLNDFRRIHAKGLRPVLIGVGTAWTGVDLSDSEVSPEQDTLLTDLVITRLPVSLNSSLSMQQRVNAMGLYPLVNETLLTLKQGLGRLIRRDGVTSRHIWFLDGRADASYQWNGMHRLTSGVRRMLRDYSKHEVFEMEFKHH